MIDLAADGPIVELVRHAAIGIVGFAALSGVLTVFLTFGYRRWTTRPIPVGAAVLCGVGSVAIWTVSTLFREGSVLPDLAPTTPASAAYVLCLLGTGTLVAVGGRRIGDHVACEVAGITPLDGGDELDSLVASARVTVEVEFPETVEVAAGYRAVEEPTERALSGLTVRCPRRCADAELEERLERRIERDFAVDHAAVTLAADGTIERFAVGRRRRGIGPTLPPETVAVAIRATATGAAASGDPVEVWDCGDANRLVATGTLRGIGDGVATVLVSEADVEAFEPNVDDDRDTEGGSPRAVSAIGDSYRLVTRATRGSDGHQFVSMLRGAAESVSSVIVESGGPLDGEFVGWVPGTMLVIDRGGDLLALPGESETLRAGDRLWVLGTPELVRRLEAGVSDEVESAGKQVASRVP